MSATPATKDWASPDWRDAGAYPARASPYRWASEFLVRNAAFRAEWSAAQKALKRTRSAAARQASLDMLHRWGVAYPVLKEWRSKLLDSPFVFEIPPYSLGGARLAPELPAHIQAFAFDVRLPIDVQLSRAKVALTAYRRRYAARRKHEMREQRQRADLRILLRVLDAREAGALNIAIAATLIGPDKDGGADRVRKWYARACELRDGGYRDLALLGWTDWPPKNTR